jgi:hypothetical protein
MNADYRWAKEPDIADWLEHSRLNMGRGLRLRNDDPLVQAASKRFANNARPGLAKLMQLLGGSGAAV